MHSGLTGKGLTMLGTMNQAAAEAEQRPPQTMRMYYDEAEKNLRNQLVLIQRAREKADRLNLMDLPREEFYSLLHYDMVPY